MIAVAPISILLVTAFSLLLIRYLKPNFSYHWFVGTTGVLIAWILILILPGDQKITLSTNWGNLDAFYQENIVLNFDRLSWFFSVSIITLLLSSLLTSEAQPVRVGTTGPAPNSIVGMILITVPNLLALAAFNIFTTLILWTAADIFFLIFWLSDLEHNDDSTALARDMTVRLISLGILSWAMIQISANQLSGELSALPPDISSFLILSAGLRLGVLPPLTILSRAGFTIGSKEIFKRISTYGPALILLTRVAGSHEQVQHMNIWLIFTVISLLYAGFSWLGVNNAKMNTSFWICSVGALVVTSAITLQSQASLMWGLVFLLLGGFFSLYTVQSRLIKPLVWIAIISISSLPFTPTWIGSKIFDNPSLLWIGFLLGQSLLITSIIRHSQMQQNYADFTEPWIKTFYYIGLALLPIMLIVQNFIFIPTSGLYISTSLELNTILPGLVIVAFSIVILMLLHLSPTIVQKLSNIIGNLLALNWLYRIMVMIGTMIRRVILLFNVLLEGQAGIIWAFMILILFFTLFRL